MAGSSSSILHRLLAAALACAIASAAAAQRRNAGGEADTMSALDCTAETMRATQFNADDAVPYRGFALRLLGHLGGTLAGQRQFYAQMQQRNAGSSGKPRPAGQGGSVGPELMTHPFGAPVASSPILTGVDALQRGDLAGAEAQWSAALQTARRDGHGFDEAVLLNDLGVLDAARGRSVAARERFEAAARLFEAKARGRRESAAERQKRVLKQYAEAMQGRAASGQQSADLERLRKQYAEAMQGRTASGLQPQQLERFMQQYLETMQASMAAVGSVLNAESGGIEAMYAPTGLAITRLNQANLLAHTGQRQPAADLFEQVRKESDALAQRTGGGDERQTAAMLAQRASADLERLEQASGRRADARTITRADAPRQVRSQSSDADSSDSRAKALDRFPMWLLGEAQVSAAAAPGTPRQTTRDAESGCRKETLADVAREQPLAHAEASQRWLGAEALRLETAGDIGGAMDAQLRTALLAAIVRSPDREQSAWAALQRLAARRGEPAAAVLYGKRAVNTAQALRGQIEALPRQARQAFLAERRRAYVALVQTLLDAGRLPEAEAVLRLLKEDEGQPFVPTAARPQRGALPLAAAEAEWSTAFDTLAARGRALHAERQPLHDGLMGLLFGAARTRVAQQELLVEMPLAWAENLADSMNELGQDASDETEWKQAKAVATKPRARRSAEEQAGLDLLHISIASTLSGIDDVIAGLRTLPQDAVLFETQLTPAQRQRAAALEQRLPRQRAALATKLRWLLTEPAPDPRAVRLQLPAETRNLLDTMGDVGLSRIDKGQRAIWSITRRLDAVDADALALRQRLQPALATAGALRLDAAAQAALATGQQTLAALPAGTVAVYYLQGDTRLDALVVDAKGHRPVRINTSAAELAERINRYRKALESGSRELLPEAQALYETLWRPLSLPGSTGSTGSTGNKPATVMLSLDGALRALPFAALHDGQQWLIERHALNVYTSASPAALSKRPSLTWQIAAFGASTGGSIDGHPMKPLPAVPDELAAVVGSPAGVGSAQLRGPLGEAKLDTAFTTAALRQALARRTPVLHLASHFVFTPGDLQRSALLLGDGSALRLSELASPAWRLDHVELITLSACQTGLTGNDAFGQEVEGLATLLQAQGAAAVLATLWNVVDGSTAAFMAAMYGERERGSLSRAEAVRRAQLTLLLGERPPASNDTPQPRRSGSPAHSDGAWSHPLHWAPFVLMGNWL